MFLLDDSGSMQFELMPDDLTYLSARYIYPRANDLYGGSDYTNRVPTFNTSGDAAIFNAITRSPQNNSIYYNPSTTYEPWTKEDGTLFQAENPSQAYHNPMDESKGSRNLQQENSFQMNGNTNSDKWVECTKPNDCNLQERTERFWPAFYYWYSGGDSESEKWKIANYQRVEIKRQSDGGADTYTGHSREFRHDCADADNATCTYEEEIQNFANWYTYYRSRILAARAGIGFAFVQQGSGMRVGFGTLNQDSNDVDGVSTDVIDDGVRVFQGSDREDFFDNLYERTLSAAGTPLRYALDKAGQYFERSDNKGPWGANPGTDDNTEHSSCRRSYTVLMTDGYWSGGSSNDADEANARKNVDGSDGPTITGPNGLSYQYKASEPFKDNRDNTLADVAMYYWNRDLRPDLDNNVAPLKKNPAFWQHMSVYGVGLGVSGKEDPDAAFKAIEDGTTINWLDPKSSYSNCTDSGAGDDACRARSDDLLHAALNSRGGFFNAANPEDFSNELATVLQTIAVETRSSASSIATNSTRLDTGTLVFQARFDTRDWSGQLVAFDLNPDGSLKSQVWNTDTTGKIPAHGSRNVFTSQGTAGSLLTSALDFTDGNWDSLHSTQRAALKDGSSDADGKALLNWLRGDDTNEGSGLRIREKLLADIVNSDPFFVGNSENFGYAQLGGAEGAAYPTYLTDKSSGKAGRTAMLYVGSNGGMLHGFNANTGEEVFGFIPRSVYSGLAELADPDYSHRYFVDGSPSAGDAYLNNSWKTILVGATGAGGRSVFALDVTDPSNMGASKFMWEFASNGSSTDKLGVTMSNPVIARLDANNKWVAIFGNGYNSGDTVKLMIVDLATGALIKAIDTEVSGNGNGLASVIPVDEDRDRITDYVYAGDLKGNLWKFDLTGNNTNNWDVAIQNNGNPAPLFKAVDDNGNPQPITAQPTVGRHETSGLMVYFGTGKYFETTDAEVPPNPQIQDFYGIRDQGSQVSRADLITQTIIYEGTGTLQNNVGDDSDNTSTSQEVRVVSNNSAGTPVAHGWRLKLLSPGATNGDGERVYSRAVLRDGRIIFTSNIPDSDPCGVGGNGWLMEVDANNGGRLAYSVFDINDDTRFTDGDYIKLNGTWVPVSGLGHEEMIKTPGIIGAGEKEYKYTSGTSGNIGVTREKGSSGDLGRQSWRQLK
ncbi:MAG: pilus assembly protein [Spongiibacteraceae bacterium]|nr:pilus assembly protein [Spongiibacteraceae bacterium]